MIYQTIVLILPGSMSRNIKEYNMEVYQLLLRQEAMPLKMKNALKVLWRTDSLPLYCLPLCLRVLLVEP